MDRMRSAAFGCAVCADGTLDLDGRTLLELEDVARGYRRPSIMDVKIGFRTWYHGASESYISKCKAKDAETTQARLGFKVCGMQVRLGFRV
jgi:inositol-polyphosphate multikinase